MTDRRTPIVGPDPAQLDDDDLTEAVGRLLALGRRVAGQPLTAAAVDGLDGYPRFIAGLLFVGVQVLWTEGERRLDADALAAEVEAFLEDPGAG